jgi:hypothetical protein
VRQKADFHDRDSKPPTDPSASLQRLLASMGAGTREALWAVQLIERKAAVARWRGPIRQRQRWCVAVRQTARDLKASATRR